MTVMENTSKVLIALGAGFVIGGVLGILFAPDKGSVIRHKISDTGKKLAEKFKHDGRLGKEKKDEQLSKVNDEVEEFA
jgi:gas vesicle protein